MNPTTSEPEAHASLTLRPIGVVHSPYRERVQAPRQPLPGSGSEGTLELFPASGIDYALLDLSSFRYIWVLFWFHRNSGFRPKVLPPRSDRRRGVFATRAPYRPNPIGLSAVELIGIEGRRLSVRNLDMLDGTPILDLKPYIPYTDCIPAATNGWLDAAAAPPDPLPSHEVTFTPRALEQLAFLEEQGVGLRAAVVAVLELGAHPHPYRRIRQNGDGWVLAHKAWRLDFSVVERRVEVTNIRTGYRPSALADSTGADIELHRRFVARFA